MSENYRNKQVLDEILYLRRKDLQLLADLSSGALLGTCSINHSADGENGLNVLFDFFSKHVLYVESWYHYILNLYHLS